MVLEVHLFAVLRERAGRDRVTLDLAEGSTVADALRCLADQHEPLAEPLSGMSMVMAVNQSYARMDAVLHGGDELALIPPVSGGATSERCSHALVREDALSLERLAGAVTTSHTGAVVTFQGLTRDVERLDYEAYGPMAEKLMRQILRDVAARHEIEDAAAEHRVGAVALGEPSVIVAVAAAHREAAFAAGREVIDRIKSECPIWKREVDAGRTEWVNGESPGGFEGGADGAGHLR